MADKRIEREYGLIYVGKDDRHYLYKSYFIIDNLIKTIETDKNFKKIDKKGIIIVRYIDGTTYLLDLKNILEGKLWKLL